MSKLLIVIDVQNDFVSGVLGTPEAQAIIPKAKEKIDSMHEKNLFKLKPMPSFEYAPALL